MARSWLEWRLLRPDGELVYTSYRTIGEARSDAEYYSKRSGGATFTPVRVQVTVHEPKKGKGKRWYTWSDT